MNPCHKCGHQPLELPPLHFSCMTASCKNLRDYYNFNTAQEWNTENPVCIIETGFNSPKACLVSEVKTQCGHTIEAVGVFDKPRREQDVSNPAGLSHCGRPERASLRMDVARSGRRASGGQFQV